MSCKITKKNMKNDVHKSTSYTSNGGSFFHTKNGGLSSNINNGGYPNNRGLPNEQINSGNDA